MSNLVSNGNFDYTPISSGTATVNYSSTWNNTSVGIASLNTYQSVGLPSGVYTQFASSGLISQTITFPSAGYYQLSYWYGASSAGSYSQTVTIGNNNKTVLFTNTTWTKEIFNFFVNVPGTQTLSLTPAAWITGLSIVSYTPTTEFILNGNCDYDIITNSIYPLTNIWYSVSGYNTTVGINKTAAPATPSNFSQYLYLYNAGLEIRIAQYISFLIAGNYNLSFWACSNNSTPQKLFVKVGNYSGNLASFSYSTFDGSLSNTLLFPTYNSWTKYNINFTVPSSAVASTKTLSFGNEMLNNGVFIFISGISLTPTPDLLYGGMLQSLVFGFYDNWPYGITNQSDNAIAFGNYAGQYNQGTNSIAMGSQAGNYWQGGNAIAIGTQSGFSRQSNYAIAVGSCAGQTYQGGNAIAIGSFAGSSTQGGNAIALGAFAGNASQSADSVALGSYAGSFKQGTAAIAIGSLAGYSLQGVYSICIGNGAGSVAAPGNSIILNAGSSALNPTFQNAFYVAPVRNDPTNTTNWLAYNTATSEITSFDKNTSIFTFGNTAVSTSTSTGAVVISNGGLGVGGNVSCSALYLSSKYFGVVSWTTCGYSVSGSIAAYNGSVLGTSPTPSNSNTFQYNYSIKGNTMYLYFLYNSVVNTSAAAGSGVYYYTLPTGYTIDAGLISFHGSPTTAGNLYPVGSLIGNAKIVCDAGKTMNAQVVPLNSTQLGLFVWQSMNAGNTYATSLSYYWQSSSIYAFNNTNLYISWNASFPIYNLQYNYFLPIFVSGLSLWFDAYDSTTITKDISNVVSQWNDKSGYNRNAKKYSSSSGNLVYNSTGFNNLPTLQWPQSKYGLVASLPSGSLSSGVSCFVLSQKTGNNNLTEALVSRTTANLPNCFDLYSGTRIVGNGVVYGGATTSNTIQNTSVSLFSFTISTGCIWKEYKNGGDGTGSGAGPILNSTISTTYGDGANSFYIGSRADMGTNFTGNMSEVLVFNSVLTDANRQKIEGYLMWKWGLQNNLPTLHPYKNYDPTK